VELIAPSEYGNDDEYLVNDNWGMSANIIILTTIRE
jgi:hypothetical protein